VNAWSGGWELVGRASASGAATQPCVNKVCANWWCHAACALQVEVAVSPVSEALARLGRGRGGAGGAVEPPDWRRPCRLLFRESWWSTHTTCWNMQLVVAIGTWLLLGLLGVATVWNARVSGGDLTRRGVYR
jgi:hypothetical protein